jgi:hypothetical protein
MADNPAFWARAVEQARERREGWRSERRPSELGGRWPPPSA